MNHSFQFPFDLICELQELVASTHPMEPPDLNTLARAARLRVRELSIPITEYLSVVSSSGSEKILLLQSAINCETAFIRNPDSFNFLSTQIIDKLCTKKSKDPLRVWVSGCSGGHEAFSIAFCILERLNQLSTKRDIRIVGTDWNAAALEEASAGRFDRAELEDVPKRYLAKYFSRVESGFVIRPPVRKCIHFSLHDAEVDPPLTKIDLVSCRNMLKYKSQISRIKLISSFHLSLNPGGYLFLGQGENLDELADEFIEISQEHRVFQKKRDVRLAFSEFPSEKGGTSSHSLEDSEDIFSKLLFYPEQPLKKASPLEVVVDNDGISLPNDQKNLLKLLEELQSSNEILRREKEKLKENLGDYEKKSLILETEKSDFLLAWQSMKAGFLLLDDRMRVQRFVLPEDSLITLRSEDIARPIQELAFRYDHEEILNLISQVLQTGKPVSRIIKADNNNFSLSICLDVHATVTPELTKEQSVLLSFIVLPKTI